MNKTAKKKATSSTLKFIQKRNGTTGECHAITRLHATLDLYRELQCSTIVWLQQLMMLIIFLGRWVQSIGSSKIYILYIIDAYHRQTNTLYTLFFRLEKLKQLLVVLAYES